MTDVRGSSSFYEVLGISPTATTEDVRVAYRRLCRQAHPDAGGNSTLFHLVARAHETLSDPVRRAAYDDSLRQPSELASPVRDGREVLRSGLRSVFSRAMNSCVAVGSSLGLLWYLLRSTGALALALGDSAAERPVPAAVGAWAQPTTCGKALICLVVGAVLVARGPFARVQRRFFSVRRASWTEWAVASFLVVSVLLAEYLLTSQGRRALVASMALGAGLFVMLVRRRRVLA